MTKSVQRWVSIAILAAVVALGVTGSLLVREASAQSAGELRLQGSGVPINLVAKPDSVATTDVSVRNIGSKAETLKVGLQKFGQDATGNPTLSDRGAEDKHFDWVTLTPSEFTIQPNEQKTVRVTINVPAEAAFGYYYAVTFTRAADEKNPNGQTVKGSLATLVLLEAQVPGAKRELAVESFKTAGVYEFLPARFTVKIKNTGNVHAIPYGDVTVGQGNTELARMAINPAGGYVLPGATRTFTVEWNDGFPRTVQKTKDGKAVIDANGQVETDFEVNWANASKFRIGQYTADLVMVYDNGQRDVPIEREAQFLVLPWKLLILVLIIVGLIIWAIVKDIIKLEHFLFGRGKKNKSKAASTSRSSTRKPTAKKPAARKKTTTTRKRK